MLTDSVLSHESPTTIIYIKFNSKSYTVYLIDREIANLSLVASR